jgi:omega-6 fatty acid desaturase (delta-12 desaturase)
MNTISAKEVRAATMPFTNRKNTTACLILIIDVAAAIAVYYLALTSDTALLKILLSPILGLLIGLLFVVGHDCCHGCYFTSPKLNKWVGTLAFLPSLHNYALWELGHNHTHHRYTNLKTHDYVYRPLTKEEYWSLSPFHQLKYRLYRSSIGHLFYYLIEIWIKKMIVPHSAIPNITNITSYWKYSILLVVYILMIAFATTTVSADLGQSVIVNLLIVVVLPFIIWNWIMGFIIYQHHTNVDTRWYQDLDEWDYWECQLADSIHIRYPQIINRLIHNIMEHTAHHSNMAIPLYNLPNAQRELEKHFGTRIKVIDWNIMYYLRSIRHCKLYDYHSHSWYSFDAVHKD